MSVSDLESQSDVRSITDVAGEWPMEGGWEMSSNACNTCCSSSVAGTGLIDGVWLMEEWSSRSESDCTLESCNAVVVRGEDTLLLVVGGLTVIVGIEEACLRTVWAVLIYYKLIK